MTYTNVALQEKIREMYPEIKERNLSMGLRFDPEKSAYVRTLSGEKGS